MRYIQRHSVYLKENVNISNTNSDSNNVPNVTNSNFITFISLLHSIKRCSVYDYICICTDRKLSNVMFSHLKLRLNV